MISTRSYRTDLPSPVEPRFQDPECAVVPPQCLPGKYYGVVPFCGAEAVHVRSRISARGSVSICMGFRKRRWGHREVVLPDVEQEEDMYSGEDFCPLR